MSTEVKAALSEKERQQLESLYTFREPEKVVQYLEENPYLVPLLLEAPVHLHKVFPDAPLYLYVSVDPEIAGYVQLVGAYNLSKVALEPEAVIAKMSQFGYDWWYKAMDRIPDGQRWRLHFMWDFE